MERDVDGLAFDANFDNGNLDRVIRMGVNWYHVALRPDTWFFFHFRVTGCKGREIIFEYDTRATSSNAKCPLANRKPPAVSARPEVPQPYENRPWVSYDGRTWNMVDSMEQDFRYPRSFRFKHHFTEDEAFLCHTQPYRHGDMVAWLATLADDPRVETAVLGRSRNGVEQPLLRITADPDARDLVILIAREDADEPLGSWGIEGVVRRLLNGEPEDLLKRYVFKIAPMVCVDGVIAGASHSAGYGYGGFRWHEEPSPEEIENVKNAIRGWVDQGYRLRLAGKLHGGNTLLSKQDQAANSQDVLTSSPELRQALRRDTDAFWVAKEKNLEIRPQGYFERFMLDTFGFGNTFATHIQGASAENARRSGEGLMRNIGTWLMGTTEG